MSRKGEEILRERFRFIQPIQVRFRDMDAMGHVNNAVYLTYLEMARVGYYRNLFGLTRPGDFPFILARVEIDFRSPVLLGEEILVGIRVSSVGNKSFHFEYEIRETETGRLVAEAKSVQVMYDYRKGATMPVPDDFRKRLEEFEGARFG